MLWFKKNELELKNKIAKLEKELNIYKTRCRELEDGVEEAFGVKIRTEVTEVNIVFTAMELTVLYTALCKLMERPLVTEDLQYYLTLRLKIEDLLKVVKE
jgi:hypothetical protein